MSGRPLLDNRVDAEMFVGREVELSAIAAALMAGLNVVVAGDPGIGKTSLLRTLMYRGRTTGRTRQPSLVGDFGFTYVRAEGVTTARELLLCVVGEVLGAAGDPEDTSAALLARLAQARQDRVDSTRERWEAQSPGASDGAVLTSVIIVDDVTAAAGHALFGRMRDELWNLGYVWIVSVRTAERGGLLLPPADAFFDRQINLGPLDTATVNELVARRTGAPADGWPARIRDAVGGNPRRILDVVRDVVSHPGSTTYQDALDATGQRDAAIHALGRPESMLAAELATLGAASASDDALLDRLGWTRGRAVQVLSTLEKAGLVRSEEAHTGKQGRPRKIYRLTPATEYILALNAEAGR